MNIQFHINYFTQPGQVVMLTGNNDILGNGNESHAIQLIPLSDGNWKLELELDAPGWIEYNYFIRKDGETERRESGRPHRAFLPENTSECLLLDFWQAESSMGFLYASAFTDSLLSVEHEPEISDYLPNRVVIKVIAPFVRRNQCLGLSGDNALFGAWRADKALRMHSEHFPEWTISLDSNSLPISSNYKFVLLEKESGKIIHYEWGEPRMLTVPQDMDREIRIYSGMVFRFQEAPWKGAGVAIPVFSLRSAESWGCGDFGDLTKMIDWSVDAGLQLIQTLPVNDTTLTETWTDSYPYSAISSCALHPIYCSMKLLPALSNAQQMADFESFRVVLNQKTQVDYEGILKLKWKYFKALYLQESATVFESNPYRAFFEKNKKWLIPYAAFCYLRWKTGKNDFREWGEWSMYQPEKIAKLCQPANKDYAELAIHFFIQFLLDKQLVDVKNYAHAHAVVLKGDIPIGVSRLSVEAWSESSLFNMDVQVGAPPDDFSLTGQNWGFPSYNWEAMKVEDYRWWKQRFTKMADYYDAYRIDHILGFFRIWEIPSHAVDGLLGHFSPALALSVEEMQRFGFQFEDESMVQPFLTENLLHYHFGKKTASIIRTYLKKRKDGLFELKKEFETQQLINASFTENPLSPETIVLRDKLLSLCTEVLFVNDSQQPDLYHPRISAYATERFRCLRDDQKQAYTNLYNDFFYARNNEFWKQKALEKLRPLIRSNRMLACGEDLGMIPSCVPDVMHQLGILSLEIQRMPKTFNVMFENLNNIPYESVVTTSTHDMPPLRAWWLENRERTQQFYNQILWKAGDAPWECTPELASQIIRNHMFAPSIWVILPLQDILAMDSKLRNPDPLSERINIPSNPANYWCYRMHLTLEQLLRAKVFNAKFKEMVEQSGRN
jgi:4-alpha-glucanotransferase